MEEYFKEDIVLLFREGLIEMGLDLDEAHFNSILVYFGILLEKNKSINLISRKMDIRAQVSCHLLDSLSPLLWSGWPSELKALDIGSGGGLPAIPLSIVYPGWTYTLAESTVKKASFLENLKIEMKLNNINIINQYIEPLGKKEGDMYDLITVRAVSELSKLIPLVGPLLVSGGYFLAFKGPQARSELSKAAKLLSKWNLVIEDEFCFSLPFTQAHRTLLLFLKK